MDKRYWSNPEVHKARFRAYRHRHPERTIWRRIRQRAHKEGLAFDLSPQDIHIPAVCPALGLPLAMNSGCQADNSISVDRLDPTRGYVRGNIAIISLLANRIKSNATAEQVAAVAHWMKHGTSNTNH